MPMIHPYTKFTQINLPSRGPIDPESVALDRFYYQGPYAGVSDGRVLKYEGPTVGIERLCLHKAK